jgi:hypothetical protein
MEENETLQPITRAEFEAGVVFFVRRKPAKYDFFDTFSLHEDHAYIIDKKGNYYCSILYYDEEGFMFIHWVFGQKNEFKILFKNCFKVPKK